MAVDIWITLTTGIRSHTGRDGIHTHGTGRHESDTSGGTNTFVTVIKVSVGGRCECWRDGTGHHGTARDVTVINVSVGGWRDLREHLDHTNNGDTFTHGLVRHTSRYRGSV